MPPVHPGVGSATPARAVATDLDPHDDLKQMARPKRARARAALVTHVRSGAVRAIAFSSDGARLAVGGDDRTVALYDAAKGGGADPAEPPLLEFKRQSAVDSLAFSADGRLAIGGRDGTLSIENTKDGAEHAKYGDVARTGAISTLSFAPDGRLALGDGGGGVAVLEPTNGEVVLEIGRDGAVRAVSFSPDGARLAIGASASLAILDLER